MWMSQATQRTLPHLVTMFLTCQSCRIRGKMTTMMILHLQLHQLHQVLLLLLRLLRLLRLLHLVDCLHQRISHLLLSLHLHQHHLHLQGLPVLHPGLLLHLLCVYLHLLCLRLRLHLHSLRLSTLHPLLALVLHLYTSQLEVAVVSGPTLLLLAKSSPLALLATLALSMRMSSNARTWSLSAFAFALCPLLLLLLLHLSHSALPHSILLLMPQSMLHHLLLLSQSPTIVTGLLLPVPHPQTMSSTS